MVLNTPGAGAPGTPKVKWTGLAYKVGFGVILTGVAIAASSWLLGGVIFAAVSALLSLLGAPEDHTLLPLSEPEAGGKLLQLLGVVLLACGGCMMSLRLVAELVGLAGRSRFVSRLERTERLGAGAAAIGFVTVVVTGLTQTLLREVFLYDYGANAAIAALETTGYAAGVVLFGGLALLVLGRSGRHRVLLGWTDRVGWGRLGYGWINKLGLGLIVLALAGGLLGFEDLASIIAAAGIAILLVGIVPHFLTGGRP